MIRAFLSLVLLVSFSLALEYACVDTERIVRESKFIAKTQAKFKREVQVYQRKIERKQKQLERLIKEVESKALSEKARERKMSQIRKLENELRKLQLEAQAKLGDKKAKLEKMILEKVVAATEKVAKKKKLKAVFDCAAMLYRDKSLDITGEVIKVLDSQK